MVTMRMNPARVRPRNRAQLRGWLKAALGLDVPGGGRCVGHGGPLDYLEHVFFERGGDAIVWANRGGGKTFYGAVATLLDVLFKPGVSVCILGGSLEQSSRMYAYLKWMLDRPWARGLVAGKVTQRGLRLRNGSRVTLAAASQTSVRGQRVQKLRCDEVELFDREIWDAAQFVTRSAMCGGVWVRGSVEAMSTMHRPFGLMHELVEGARADAMGGGEPAASGGAKRGERAGGWRVFEWCAMDVMARCEAERVCEGCRVWDACQGRAKGWRGFLRVADVLGQRERSGAEQFASEMLCERPSRSDAVFARFDPAVHVRAVEADAELMWVGGMDFGLRDPTVMLWAQLRPPEVKGGRGGSVGDVCIEVVDEYVQSEAVMDRHLEQMRERGWPMPRWLGVDPAGGQRSSQTGRSTIDLLREAGYRVRHVRSGVAEGLMLLQRRLDPACGRPSLVIHPRCVRLIESMTCYHYDADRPTSPLPVKDGYDHAVDALRYLVVNLERRARVSKGRY